LIRIPKGHYAAEFTYAEPTALPDNRTAAAWLSEQERLASLSASGHWATGQRSLLVLAVALLLVIASLSFWVYRLRSEDAVHLNGSHNVDLRQSLLWSTFLHGETHSIAVVGIASSVSIGPVIVRVPDANDDQSMQSDPTIQKLSGLFDKPVSPYNIYTGIGEALAAGKLERAFTDSSLDLSLLASREVRWQDLHADNVIFISSLRFRDLRNALGRTSDFDAAEFSNGQLQIINHAPRPGEQSSYAPSGNSTQPTVDYALVSIVPGTASNRSILSVGGMSTLGTLGAMQYITEKQSLTDLDTKLRHDSTPKTHSSVQILLRVDIIDYQVVSVHYVTHHWIS
jgi:hypothetical protein